jgi:hypothetical protein
MPQMVEIPPPSEGRPIPPKFELRPLTTLSRADLQEATMMLAYAFDEQPLFRLAFPKAASRSKILQTLFTTVLKDAIRFGRAVCLSGILPAAIRCPNPESCVCCRIMRALLRSVP